MVSSSAAHLPFPSLQACLILGAHVGLQEEGQQDSQLINSVYLDNSSMELYHGRLDKKPSAIALRIR